MAIKYYAGNRYVGLSTDVKPTTNVRIGANYHETDTHSEFLFNGVDWGVLTGVSGYSGFSGYTGFSGFTGYTGYSGYSGRSGFSGYSGFSGISGYSGAGIQYWDRNIVASTTTLLNINDTVIIGNDLGLGSANKLTVSGNVAESGARRTVLRFDPSNPNTPTSVSGGPLTRGQNLAFYSVERPAITGAIKITLPTSWSNTMMKLVVDGFNYASETSLWRTEIAGYNYDGVPDGWYNCNASLLGNIPGSGVYLGHDGTNCCVIIGESGNVWSYPKIVLSDAVFGYYATKTMLTGNWSIDIVSDTSNISGLVQANINNSFRIADGTQGANRVLTSDAYGRATWSTISGAGISGYSGYSGISGFSGFSGISGFSGFSGRSGYSGFSGLTGAIGPTGISGFSGFSGFTGFSGFSGFSGISGYTGYSGISGYSGFSGYSGISGYSGASFITRETAGGISTLRPTTNTDGFSLSGNLGAFGGLSISHNQTDPFPTLIGGKLTNMLANYTGRGGVVNLTLGTGITTVTTPTYLYTYPNVPNAVNNEHGNPSTAIFVSGGADTSVTVEFSGVQLDTPAYAVYNPFYIHRFNTNRPTGIDVAIFGAPGVWQTVRSGAASFRHTMWTGEVDAISSYPLRGVRFTLHYPVGNYTTYAMEVGVWNRNETIGSYIFAMPHKVNFFEPMQTFRGGVRIPHGSPQSGRVLMAIDTSGQATWVAATSVAGLSGYSGYSGYSGQNGAAGSTGLSGFSGYSGYSGISGYSGTSGYSGLSGFSGYSGISGFSGYSGISGYSGQNGGGASSFRYTYSSTTTDSDPGAGFLRLNNTTFSSATRLYIDNVDALGTTTSAWVDAWDDSTTAANKGIITIRSVSTPANWAIYYAGTVTDATGYRRVILTHISSSATTPFSNGESVMVDYSMAGASGANGSTGPEGLSGYSGYSGISGYSGYSGISGYTGYSGRSGYSGISGYTGFSGFSGYSGQAGGDSFWDRDSGAGKITALTASDSLEMDTVIVLNRSNIPQGGASNLTEDGDISLSTSVSGKYICFRIGGANYRVTGTAF